MKRERLFRKQIKDLKNVTVDYYLTTDCQETVDKYGVCLVKFCTNNLIEEYASVDHVWRHREQAEQIIKQLADGETTPVSLTDIIDDFLAK